MIRKMKKGMVMLLVVTMIFGFAPCIDTKAAELETKLNWMIKNIRLHHKSVSFTIGEVESAQEATVVVVDSDTKETVFEKAFSITSSSQNIKVDITDGYLKSGRYNVYVKNSANEKTESSDSYLTNHQSYFWISGEAYPNCFVGNILSTSALSLGLNVKVIAMVGFQEYDGMIDGEGNIKIEYPTQSVGSIIKLKVSDEYGCEYISDKTVEDVNFSKSTLHAWHTGVSLSWYNKLNASERIGVEVDGKAYYSEYGAKSGSGEAIIVSYPDTTSKEVSVWYESKYGSKSESEKLEVKSCELKDCEYEIYAFQYKAAGTVTASSIAQIPNQVKATLDGKDYSADINADGTFTIDYPSQTDYKEISFVFTDQHACSYKKTAMVYNSLSNLSPGIVMEAVLPTIATMDDGIADVRIVAQIGSEKYYGEYGAKSVTYPYQAVGTAIKFWLEAKNSCVSQIQNTKVYDGDYVVKVNARTGSARGDIYIADILSDYCADITSAYAEINGKKYNCKLEKKKGNEDYWGEAMEYYHFSVTYPIQKIGTKVTICFTDNNQITGSKKIILSNIAPKISLDKVDSSSTKISGVTVAKSSVTIRIGKKKYTCKANAEGKFSTKVKEQKKGTKVSISVLSPEGYTNTYSTKIKQATGSLWISNYVYKFSSSIKMKLINAKKGDKVKVVVGSKTYTKKITSNKKIQKINIKIKKASAGTSVKATLYDKFSKKKDYEKTMVYFGNNIYIGMSARDAELTTWGYPVRKNDYGYGSIQWVYESGKTIMYVYVRSGKVVNIQKLNY